MAPPPVVTPEEEEGPMLTIHDRIRELRAELAGCLLTRRERARTRAELDRLVALQAAMDTVADAVLCTGVAPPG